MPEITCKWVKTTDGWSLEDGPAAECKPTKPSDREGNVGDVKEITITVGGPGADGE